MSNYTKQISWSGKDALSDSDPEKVISGGDFDTEFSAVQTAINSKIDTGGVVASDIASNAITEAKIADNAITEAKIADNAITEAKIADNAITLAKMAHGTDGEIITYDSSGAPATVGVGTSGQVLTSNGAGSAPSMQSPAAAGADTSLSNLSATGENRVCQAWVNFNGTGTPSIRDSYNVSSITDRGQGLYTVNFSTSMPNTNYSVIGSNIGTTTHPHSFISAAASSPALSTSNFRIDCVREDNYVPDQSVVSVQVFGD